MSEPDMITPPNRRRDGFVDKLRRTKKSLTTKEGLIGSYDYGFLFKPQLPFMKKERKASPFFGLNDHMPLFLALLLGLQHALAMLAGVMTPPLILGGSGGANLPQDQQSYLVSASLIVCGILSSIQITRFHIWKTPYYVGTGLISVVGTSFATIPVAQGALNQMYANGMCPIDAETGKKLPCPEGYGAILGTAIVCSLLEIGMSFMPPKIIKKLFPPIVTGPTVMLIGVKLIASGLKNWGGGSNDCYKRAASGFFQYCSMIPRPMQWGAPEYIGLGFSVFVTILIMERFGAPIMKSCSVVLGLLVGCIIAGATGYFSRTNIDNAPVVTFIWVHSFPLSVYGPLVLPLLAVYIILACEAIGDITATCDVSRIEVEGDVFNSRIQGGVLADGLNGLLAGLCTMTPMSTFAQNNGVIALTRCANRKVGYACCFFLIVMGIFAKFAASLVSIPAPVLGGMTTFLFTAVAVSGMSITAASAFTRRTRFILTASLMLGYGATLVPDWFSYVFTYTGDNKGKQGIIDAVELVMSTGFAITALTSIFLNLVMAEDEDLMVIEDAPSTQDERLSTISSSEQGEKGAAINTKQA